MAIRVVLTRLRTCTRPSGEYWTAHWCSQYLNVELSLPSRTGCRLWFIGSAAMGPVQHTEATHVVSLAVVVDVRSRSRDGAVSSKLSTKPLDHTLYELLEGLHQRNAISLADDLHVPLPIKSIRATCYHLSRSAGQPHLKKRDWGGNARMQVQRHNVGALLCVQLPLHLRVEPRVGPALHPGAIPVLPQRVEDGDGQMLQLADNLRVPVVGDGTGEEDGAAEDRSEALGSVVYLGLRGGHSSTQALRASWWLSALGKYIHGAVGESSREAACAVTEDYRQSLEYGCIGGRSHLRSRTPQSEKALRSKGWEVLIGAYMPRVWRDAVYQGSE